MIKHLSGDYETVEYEEKRCIMLYHNTQYEEYPVHWHQEIEIIMPLRKCYRLEIGDREYVIGEKEVFLIPPGEVQHLVACEGERLILQCDNSLLGAQPMFDSIMRGLKAPVLIDESYGSELQAVAKKTMLEIYSLYFSGSERVNSAMAFWIMPTWGPLPWAMMTSLPCAIRSTMGFAVSVTRASCS